jgi:hypothetical protein
MTVQAIDWWAWPLGLALGLAISIAVTGGRCLLWFGQPQRQPRPEPGGLDTRRVVSGSGTMLDPYVLRPLYVVVCGSEVFDAETTADGSVRMVCKHCAGDEIGIIPYELTEEAGSLAEALMCAHLDATHPDYRVRTRVHG